MSSFPRMSFGIIVLNGEPFTRYTLNALYPFAHQILVVEGATPHAAQVATSDGHSRDGTLEVLRDFKANHDPADKLTIITKDGFWEEKDEMSQAYAEQATGDYLWQVDIDEYYKAQDMQAIINILHDNPSITGASFKMITFWASPKYYTDGWYLRRGAAIYHRLFKWGPGYHYATHRPPTVHNEKGEDLRTLNWINSDVLTRQGIIMYHCSLLFPKQVYEKSEYYSQYTQGASGDSMWFTENYMNLKHPFRVHNVKRYPSWLSRFKGDPPEPIQRMFDDVQQGAFDIQVRQTDDIEQLLSSPLYFVQRAIIMGWDYVMRGKNIAKRRAKYFLRRVKP